MTHESIHESTRQRALKNNPAKKLAFPSRCVGGAAQTYRVIITEKHYEVDGKILQPGNPFLFCAVHWMMFVFVPTKK